MARAIAWELDLLGSHGMAAADYPGMLAMIESGELRPHDLIERVIGLEEGAALLPILDNASPAGITLISPRPSRRTAGEPLAREGNELAHRKEREAPRG
jgi:alcohol dehydrogenase